MAYILIYFDAGLLYHNGRTIQGLAKFVGFSNEKSVAEFLIGTELGKEMLRRMLDITVFDAETGALHCEADWAFEYCTDGLTPQQAFDNIIAHYSTQPEQIFKDMDKCWKDGSSQAMALVKEDEKLFSILVGCHHSLDNNYSHGVITADG